MILKQSSSREGFNSSNDISDEELQPYKKQY